MTVTIYYKTVKTVCGIDGALELHTANILLRKLRTKTDKRIHIGIFCVVFTSLWRVQPLVVHPTYCTRVYDIRAALEDTEDEEDEEERIGWAVISRSLLRLSGGSRRRRYLAADRLGAHRRTASPPHPPL